MNIELIITVGMVIIAITAISFFSGWYLKSDNNYRIIEEFDKYTVQKKMLHGWKYIFVKYNTCQVFRFDTIEEAEANLKEYLSTHRRLRQNVIDTIIKEQA